MRTAATTTNHDASQRSTSFAAIAARACAAAPQFALEAPNASLARRVAIFAYGVVSYAFFFGTFVYALGFVGNFLTPTTLDRLPTPTDLRLGWAILVDVGLLLAFAIQHSVMARPRFKACFTRVIPEAAERSTYVLLSSVLMTAIFVLWQPLGGAVWDVQQPIARAVLYGLLVSGWLIVLAATFMINHFDLFGLRQVWLFLRNKPYTNLPFKTPGFYSRIRHPLYAGWLIMFWATPTMTAAHLLFAVVTAVYMLTAIQLEERDLVSLFGSKYLDYRRRVPMLLPRLRGAGPAAAIKNGANK